MAVVYGMQGYSGARVVRVGDWVVKVGAQRNRNRAGLAPLVPVKHLRIGGLLVCRYVRATPYRTWQVRAALESYFAPLHRAPLVDFTLPFMGKWAQVCIKAGVDLPCPDGRIMLPHVEAYHGDLSPQNMVWNTERLHVFDAIDSYIPSRYMDYVKLRQGWAHGWHCQPRPDLLPALPVVPALDALNFLRLLPYAVTDSDRKEILKIVNTNLDMCGRIESAQWLP